MTRTPTVPPPRSRGGLFSWLMLVVCLVLVSPPLWLDLGQPDVTRHEEAVTLATSAETWRRLSVTAKDNRFLYDRWEPLYNGKPRLETPPAVTWMHKLAFEHLAARPTFERQWSTTVDATGQVTLAELGDFDVTELSFPAFAKAVVARADEQGFAVQATVKVRNGEPAADEADERRFKAGQAITVDLKGLKPEWRAAVDVETLILLARGTAVACAVMLLAAVFWAGHTLGGLPTAVFSLLIVASHPLFVMQARFAEPAIYRAAWASVAVAAALWAIRPMKPASSVARQFSGWLICGLSIGVSILTVGSQALWWVLPAILFIMAMTPQRFGHLMGLLAALLIGILLVTPWALHAHQQSVDAWRAWLDALLPFRTAEGEYFTGMWLRTQVLLLVMMPWTIWMLAGLAQPFSHSSSGRRQRLLLGVSWGVGLSVLYLLTPYAHPMTGLLPILPAAAIVAGMLFSHYSELASEGRTTRLWRWLRWPHGLLLVIASFALPWVLYDQGRFIAHGWLDTRLTGPWSLLQAIGLGCVLLGVALMGIRYLWTHYPAKTVVTWAVWSWLAVCVLTMPLARGPIGRDPQVRAEAQVLASLTRNSPAYWLHENAQPEPDPALLFYAGRSLPVITEAKVADAAAELPGFYLITTPDRTSPSPRLASVALPASLGLKIWRGPVDESGTSRDAPAAPNITDVSSLDLSDTSPPASAP